MMINVVVVVVSGFLSSPITHNDPKKIEFWEEEDNEDPFQIRKKIMNKIPKFDEKERKSE